MIRACRPRTKEPGRLERADPEEDRCDAQADEVLIEDACEEEARGGCEDESSKGLGGQTWHRARHWPDVRSGHRALFLTPCGELRAARRPGRSRGLPRLHAH